jgi:hypothetical protein
MKLRVFGLLAALPALAGATSADAASGAFTIRATVPLHCKARLDRVPVLASTSGTVELGQLSEYCNAPRGYQLVVRYGAGTLEGTTIRVGEDTVVLNGSGLAMLSESRGPRIRSRTISVTPGDSGLQTDRLEVLMIPSA